VICCLSSSSSPPRVLAFLLVVSLSLLGRSVIFDLKQFLRHFIDPTFPIAFTMSEDLDDATLELVVSLQLEDAAEIDAHVNSAETATFDLTAVSKIFTDELL
jgi:hypothetical protein